MTIPSLYRRKVKENSVTRKKSGRASDCTTGGKSQVWSLQEHKVKIPRKQKVGKANGKIRSQP